jgi:hypothetical protein
MKLSVSTARRFAVAPVSRYLNCSRGLRPWPDADETVEASLRKELPESHFFGARLTDQLKRPYDEIMRLERLLAGPVLILICAGAMAVAEISPPHNGIEKGSELFI